MATSRYGTRIVPFLIVALFAGFVGRATAEPKKSPVSEVNTADGIGVKGYDPVAYFVAGRPRPGVDRYSYRWMGVNYRFASTEDRKKFAAEPEKYLPQYGGYCAYAMSINRIADADPSRWAMVNGQLYLNNGFVAQRLWSLDKRGNIESADLNWLHYPKHAEGK